MRSSEGYEGKTMLAVWKVYAVAGDLDGAGVSVECMELRVIVLVGF